MGNDKSIESKNIDLIIKRKEMSKETWIKNVMRVYPNRTREETENLWQKLFEYDNTRKEGNGK